MAGKPGSPQEAAAEKLATELEAAGLKVLFDDRVKVSPGVRFKDAELIGVPTIAVVGRGIEADEPTIEVKDRRSGDREDIGLSDVVAHLVEVCRN
jgi:prolyl-tRNA synthetase